MDTPKVIGEAVTMCEDCGYKEIVTAHLATWLTQCLRSQVTPEHFKEIWDKFWEDDNEGMAEPGEVPGYTYGSDDDDPVLNETLNQGIYWGRAFYLRGFDSFEDDEALTLPKLYRQAVLQGADKFVVVTEDEASYVVAVSGNPGADAIYKAVRPESSVRWPDEFSPGTPIAQLHQSSLFLGEAILEDGTWVFFSESSIPGTKNKCLVNIYKGHIYKGHAPKISEDNLVRQYEIEVNEGEN